ncbi:hypothetical protein FEM48_Zijuj01G0083600 [Ziziphus jujuba var. spinosa]|uniref:NADH-ubiquinone oxidoreductase 21kDa subunit N-terminal domain-containing protein n=1 Tax=Ziziphus jujuba var. spinosa TaxID=714518 RepID=A0A978W059_ZIZJJ|nr:hypothetical protein FEM48_Zijuj01G0083600 [Ziziphus jujuba var. spinosa]
MNTDITASTKPEYPVIDRNPPFTKVVGNFSSLDYLRFVTITGVSVTVGYLSGFSFFFFFFLVLGAIFQPLILYIFRISFSYWIRGPSMVTGGLIGLMGGFMYAYQNSAGRLMGFFPNDDEYQTYGGKEETPRVLLGVSGVLMGQVSFVGQNMLRPLRPALRLEGGGANLELPRILKNVQ